MRTISALSAFLGILAAPTLAQTTEGNDLLRACQDAGQAQQGFCIGWVIGAIEGIRFGVAYPMMMGASSADEINDMSNSLLMNCLPDNVENSQYVDVVVRHLERHPEKRHHPARFLALEALQEAFPCG